MKSIKYIDSDRTAVPLKFRDAVKSNRAPE